MAPSGLRVQPEGEGCGTVQHLEFLNSFSITIDIATIRLNPYNSLCGKVLFSIKMFPGYSGVVKYGHRSFLMIALSFALLVDAFLIANFYWTELLTTGQRNVFLIVLFGAWVLLMAVASFWQQYLDSTLTTEQHDETFRQTIGYYLRGDWFAAEAQMFPYLKKYPKDIEMLLLQATMYRHTERYEESLLVLDKLQLLQDSRYWYAEIESERALILAAQNR
jgi:hypothetical protein